MTSSIKIGGYPFLKRMDLIFAMWLWKQFKLLQILKELSIKHLVQLICYENFVKLVKFKFQYLLSVILWVLIPEINKEKQWNG